MIPSSPTLEAAAKADLSISAVRMLVALSEGPLHLSALTAHLGVSSACTTGIADTLEARRLANRRRSEDRRLVHLELTEEGRKLAMSILHP